MRKKIYITLEFPKDQTGHKDRGNKQLLTIAKTSEYPATTISADYSKLIIDKGLFYATLQKHKDSNEHIITFGKTGNLNARISKRHNYQYIVIRNIKLVEYLINLVGCDSYKGVKIRLSENISKEGDKLTFKFLYNED